MLPSGRVKWRLVMPVTIKPGAMAFTRTPVGPISAASVLVSCATAAFAIA